MVRLYMEPAPESMSQAVIVSSSLTQYICWPRILVLLPNQSICYTGTTLTHLSTPLYDFIEREVKDAMRRFTLVKHRSLLCYRVEVQEIPERIDIAFEFAGGATISVEARDLFLPNGTPGTLCLGITRSVDDDMIIIGAISMQGYNIGYNV
ncbi:unnamed protein product, partial [Brassica oleracea]